MKKRITKSLLLEHIKCPKKAYKMYHNGEVAPETAHSRALKEGGIKVGLLARDLYPGGFDASKGGTLFGPEAYQHTEDLIRSKAAIIYEAAFKSDNHSCKADIFLLKEGHIIEVKSSLSIKNSHILECGFYHHVITQLTPFYIKELGVTIRKYSIIYINKEYRRNGEIDINALFLREDVTSRVIKCQTLVKRYIHGTTETLRLKTAPKAKVEKHCDEPFPCEFKGECFHLLEGQDSILNLVGMPYKQKYYLIDRGIMNMRELPRDLKMNAKQILQVEAHLNEKIHVDKDWLEDYLHAISTKRLVFMDFETYTVPIPQFNGVTPYQQIPFQYSLHIHENGGTHHCEFMGQPGTDMREDFIKKLIKDVGDEGFIITYNQAFELARLRELSEAFPQYTEALLKIIIRVRDLMIPFRELKLYSPKMRGSYSLKKVLPALVKKLEYANDAITNGNQASATYMKQIELPLKQREHATKKLLAYCKMDTEALLEIWKFMQEIVTKSCMEMKLFNYYDKIEKNEE